jgi:hypothetical protein
VRRFYRIVRHSPPRRTDFESHISQGRYPRGDASPAVRRSFEGVSVFTTEARARERARKRNLGSYIAVLEIPEGSRIHSEQSGGDTQHFDLFSTPDELIDCVVAVIDV